ncbi:nuclear GTPase SLIP-GC-like isoform X2 [Halichoeres trimaculatus]
MLSALYKDEWENNRSPENLCHDKHFREIPEFINSEKKILTSESAKELSAKLVKYTRSGSTTGEGVQRWFWPLVKCVTVRVPNNELLQHVTLVDLPGSGDRNKSRDKMWRGVVESCSTVWIVTDINRATSDKETWEILKNASSLMGNGGQCQHIHFICTKSDVIEDSDELSTDRVHADILKRNVQAKEEVKIEFRKLNKKQFSDECFKVFTVSSKEYRKKKRLEPSETEVPKLQEFLQNLNDCHSETLNYVSGAYGILSLIQGASSTAVAVKKVDVCKELKGNLHHGCAKVKKLMEKTLRDFRACLTEGVQKSSGSWESALRNFLFPKRIKGGAYHRKLKCIVANNGTFKPKKGKQENFNEKLASWLTESIDEEFRKTFPNDSKCEPLSGAISSFTLHTEKLMEKYKDVRLQLEYLRTEEEKLKTKLNQRIRMGKKDVYNSLTATIEEIMQKCYEDAAQCAGKGSLNAMREIIERHVRSKKDCMFEGAKETMMSKLLLFMEDILNTLGRTMWKSIDLSLQTDDQSLPDIKEELETVKQYYNKLKRSSDESTAVVCIDLTGLPTAQP